MARSGVPRSSQRERKGVARLRVRCLVRPLVCPLNSPPAPAPLSAPSRHSPLPSAKTPRPIRRQPSSRGTLTKTLDLIHRSHSQGRITAAMVHAPGGRARGSLGPTCSGRSLDQVLGRHSCAWWGGTARLAGSSRFHRLWLFPVDALNRSHQDGHRLSESPSTRRPLLLVGDAASRETCHLRRAPCGGSL